MGWIGLRRFLREWLEQVGAERRLTGEYVAQGPPVVFGGDEAVVHADFQVRVQGEWTYVAAALHKRGVGAKVAVLG